MPLIRHRQADGPRLEPGTYLMECTRIREDYFPNSQYGSGNVIKFTLVTTDVVDELGEWIELEAMANDTLTPRSKLTRWLSAFGIDSDDDPDLEWVIGHQAMVSVTVDDTGQWNRISDIVAPPRSAQKATRRATGAAPPREVPTQGEGSPERYHPAAQADEAVRDVSPAPEAALFKYAQLFKAADDLGIDTKPFEIGKDIGKSDLYEKGMALRELVEAAKKDELLDEAQALFGGEVK